MSQGILVHGIIMVAMVTIVSQVVAAQTCGNCCGAGQYLDVGDLDPTGSGSDSGPDPGFNQTGSGSGSPPPEESHCSTCAVGTYQDSTAHNHTTCKNCSDLIAGSTTEEPGTTAVGRCVCGPGSQFADSPPSCEPCEGNSVNPNYDDTCTACGNGLVANDNKTTCVCAPGYERNTTSGGQNCIPYGENYVNPNPDGVCVQCGVGMVANDNRTSCGEKENQNSSTTDVVAPSTEAVTPDQTAPVTMEPMMTTMSMVECAAGEGWNGTDCLPCITGFYKSEPGNEMCQLCPTNTESVQESGSTACQCVAGTEGDGMTCTDCLKSYHPGGQPGRVSCTQCPDNTFARDRSTSADNCTAPPAETSTVQGRLLIDGVQREECERDDYENPASPGYGLVRDAITDRMLKTFPDCIGVEDVTLRCGSIDANYNLRFATVEPPAPQELTQALQTSLETDGGLVLDDGRTFTVDMTSVVFQEPGGNDNTRVFIVVAAVILIIIGFVTVLVSFKVCPRCLFKPSLSSLDSDEEPRRSAAVVLRAGGGGRMTGQWARHSWGWGQYAPQWGQKRMGGSGQTPGVTGQWGQHRTGGSGQTPGVSHGHLTGQWRHPDYLGRVSGQYAIRTPSDPYKKRFLDDVRRTPYQNTPYAIPYYKYGY